MPSRVTVPEGLDLGALIGAVQANCHLSDAHHAGDLTMCTFLLKMRELYRWEHDLGFASELPKAAIGEWMAARERLWERIESDDYIPLPLPRGPLDPFAGTHINTALDAHDLVYSGGYGRGCKPHFFLARKHAEMQRDGMRILVAGCEYARDLDAPPGMLLDDTIFIRTEALRRWLWERYEEWRWNQRNAALGRALACYPFAEDVDVALDAMTACETESVILHELGEAQAGAALGPAWHDLLAEVMKTRAEIMLRALRDLYADSLSALPGLLARGGPAALHFYFANLVGMRRTLAPTLAAAYEHWLGTGDLEPLHQAAEAGRMTWRALLDECLTLPARTPPDQLAAAVSARLAPAS